MNNKEAVCSWFKQRFSDWSSVWHEVFLTDESYFVFRPQHYFPIDQQWQTLPNLTMLGDAAHQTPPSGDGVNQAMLDALELYEALCLKNFSSMAEAIRSFEEAMLRRTAVATQEALEVTEAMLAEDNLQFMVDFFNHKDELK